MHVPLKVTYRGTTSSPALDARIRRRAAKLDRFWPAVMDCHVIVEDPHRHKRHGNLWSVRVEVRIRGGHLVSSGERGIDHAHEDVHVAIRDAFDASLRRVEEHVRRRRGQVKTHAAWRDGAAADLTASTPDRT
jgi:ribosome-associated translation inhibitor RaiA